MPRPVRVERNCYAPVVGRRREIDLILIVVWRLDRWGRSLVHLIATLQELTALKVGFVSSSEALDLTTPSGRAFVGMPAVFAEFERDILRDRVKAGIAQARKEADPWQARDDCWQNPGNPRTRPQGADQIRRRQGLNIGRTSVRRLLSDAFEPAINSLERDDIRRSRWGIPESGLL